MRRTLLLALALLLASGYVEAQAPISGPTFSQFISNSPVASSTFANDAIPLVRGGQTYRVSPTLFAGSGSGTVAAGTIGQFATYPSAGTTVSGHTLNYPDLPNIAANTVLGTIAGSAPIALTKTQLTTLVNPFTSSLSGAVSASGGGTTTFLRADNTFTAVSLASLATQATNTVVANVTSGTAVPTALAVGSCPSATNALVWITNTGFSCNSAINAATLGGATFAAPGTIGGGTPAAGTFTTLIGTSGSHVGLTSLGIRDTSAAFDVTLAATSSTALSAGRILTLDMKNVAHTLAFGATANTITFPNTASYTLVGSGDTGTVTNTMLANSATTVNGQACTLGSTCTISGSATAMTVGTTTVISGTTGRILYDNAGVLGEYAVGTGVSTALGVSVGSAGAFVTNGGALGTPSSGTATNLSGTAASLTAGTVTTNANLTGPITSSGNATSIASQTGTGTKFVVDTAPAITGGSHVGLTSFGLRDTSAAFDLTFAATSSVALTAGRTITWDTKNVAHTIVLSATANTITFPNTASYTLIGSQDSATVTGTMIAAATVTGSNIASATIAGSNIAAATIANSNLANMGDSTVKGRHVGGGTGAPEDLTSTQVAAIVGAVGGALNSKLTSFTYDLSTASGSQPISGMGFQPSACIFIGATGQVSNFSLVDSGKTAGALATIGTFATGLNPSTNALQFITDTAASNVQSAVVASYDSGGFTLTWTKTGSPTGTATIKALCFR